MYEIYTVRQNIDGRDFARCGAVDENVASEKAAKLIVSDIHPMCLGETEDGQQVWGVWVVDSLTGEGVAESLIIEEIVESLREGYTIQYIDVDGSPCGVWLSTMKVFE